MTLFAFCFLMDGLSGRVSDDFVCLLFSNGWFVREGQ